MPAFSPGDLVRTMLGKGVIREVRENGQLLVTIGDRSVLVAARDVLVVDPPKTSKKKHRAVPVEVPQPADVGVSGSRRTEVDLHGLVVVDALARVDAALNDAMLAGDVEVLFIHGRSGGRIRAALHRHLGRITSVRAFRIDPRNEGVTIVRL